MLWWLALLCVDRLLQVSPFFLRKCIDKKKTATEVTVFCTPSGTRTLDPLIKSQLLYQLS